jgi:hypothetical protein
MLPSEITNLNIKDGNEFDKQGNTMKVRTFTFFVGEHGPFTEKFLAGEQDTPAVERRINGVVAQLRELGAIPQK